MNNKQIMQTFPAPLVQNGELIQGTIHYEASSVVKNVLKCRTSNNLYEFGRILKESIYGCVYSAVRLIPYDSSSTTAGEHINHFTYHEKPQLRAIKIYNITKIRSLRQQNSAENPGAELAAMEFIQSQSVVSNTTANTASVGVVGSENVVKLHEICQDSINVYAIMDFLDGGELYDVIEAGGALGEDRVSKLY